MAKKGVGFRIPEEWYTEIQEICERRGISVSDFLIEATAKALEKDVNTVNRDLPPAGNQEAVQERLSIAEQALAALKERLTRLEQQATFSRPFPQPLMPASVNWDDLPDDEPDEVLTDFLEPEPEPEPEPVPPPLQESKLPLPSGEGLTLEQICDRYGMSFKNLSRNAKAKGQSTLEYLRDQTGLQWVQRGRRYFQLG